MPLYTTALETGRLFEIYERALNAMAQCIQAMGETTVVVDCGADVGVYSRLLLERTVAFRKLLPSNLTHSPIRFSSTTCAAVRSRHLTCQGVARAGKRHLRQPDYDESERSFFIDADGGHLELTTLDTLTERFADAPIAVKLDVEGPSWISSKVARTPLTRLAIRSV